MTPHPRTTRELHAAALAAGLAATFAAVLALVGSGRGYTVSLLFFLAPALILCGRLAGAPRADLRALAATALSGGLGGLVLDGLFAQRFFSFPAVESTLGWTLPALPWTESAATFPIEELLFYVTGSLFIAALYVWCDLSFVPEPEDRHAHVARPLRSPFVLDVRPAAIAALVVLAAWAVRAALDGPAGPPEYLSFQAAMLGLLGAVAWRIARLTINWRAFVVTQLTVLLVSLCWEVTLALPRGWWGYNVFWGGLTYNAHAFCLAVAEAVLEVMIGEGMVENAAKMQHVALAEMAALKAKHPSVRDYRCLGLFGTLELQKDRQGTRMAPYNGSHPAIDRLMGFFKQEGLFTISHWSTVMCNPPLCITEEQLREGFAVIDRGLEITDAVVTG